MKIITSNETLLKYIPNVVTSVEGEQTLFEKIYPHLVTAEQWVEDTFVSTPTLTRIASYADTTPLKPIVSACIAAEAMLKAVPSLDLVLTPNGFGIVSNQNIAPASKERVERLMQSLENNRDHAIAQMLTLLPEASQWRNSPPYKYFYGTLFPDFHVLAMLGIREHKWERYQETRQQLLFIEKELAARFFSPEEVQRWREAQRGTSDETDYAISAFQAIVIFVLRHNQYPDAHIADLINFMERHSECFTLWYDSDTRKAVTAPIFQNTKKSSGYFW